MAQIREIQLNMGQLADQQAFAEAQFSIEFSEHELRRSMQYGLYVGLFFNDERWSNARFENNGAYQTFMMPQVPFASGMEAWNASAQNGNSGYRQGSMGWNSPNAATGLVAWICRESLQPAGTRTHHINRRTTFDFTRMPSQDHSYRALVWAVPEITEGQAWSTPHRMGSNFFAQYASPQLD